MTARTRSKKDPAGCFVFAAGAFFQDGCRWSVASHAGVTLYFAAPMPWFSMKDLTEADLKAIWAYLRSLPPVKKSSAISGSAAGF